MKNIDAFYKLLYCLFRPTTGNIVSLKEMQVMKRSVVLLGLGSLITLAMLAGCATGRINAPRAYLDPAMDFSKIHTVAVVPMFPESTEDQVFSGALGLQLESALVTRQSQWKIIGSKEMLQVINSQNLGTGYKNLQADMNVPGSAMGQVAYSPATNEFIKALKRSTGADAVLVGTYGFSQSVGGGGGLLGNLVNSALGGTKVKVSLLYMNGPSAENWWTALVTRRRINDQVIQEMAESIAANIGKGTLLQL